MPRQDSGMVRYITFYYLTAKLPRDSKAYLFAMGRLILAHVDIQRNYGEDS